MDTQEKNKLDKGSIFSEKPEPIFENVVAQKYPQAYEQTQTEEVPSEITSAQEVDRPAPEVLQYIPASSREKKYKFFFVFAVIGFFILVFVGLFSVIKGRKAGPTAPVVPVTLTYWGLWEDEAVFKPIFDKYVEQNKHITIKYEKRDPNQYLAYLSARSKNKVGPDIFRFHNTWVSLLKNSDNDVFASIPQAIISSSEFEKTFHKIHQQDLKIGNDYYGIPLYVDGLVLLYNPELLKNAGVLTPPRLLAGDLIDAVSKVTVPGENGPMTAGIALGSASNVEHFSDIFGMIFLLNMLEKQDELSNVWALAALKKLPSDQTVIARGGEALQIYREFAERKYWGSSMPNSIDAFAQGKVAMIFAPTWEIPIIRAKNPDLIFSVAPVPEGVQGRKVTLASYWVEGVSRYSQNQVEAWKLLKFMSQPENQELLFKTQQERRGMGMAYSRKDMTTKLAKHPDLASLVAELDYMVSIPFASRTYDASLNDEIVEYVRKSVDSASNGVAYSAAFAEAAQGISQVLTKYKIQ